MPQETFQPAKFCPGCGYPLILLTLGRILAEKNLTEKTILGLDIGCALLALNSLPVNTFQTHHGRVVSVVGGFKKASPQSLCFSLIGDGGAYAIGLQSLMHTAWRDEPITVLVVNNSVYGMTGGQVAPTAVFGQVTETTPAGNQSPPFLGAEAVAGIARPSAYVARASNTDMPQMKSMLEMAIAVQQAGHFSLVEILTFCPTNWKTSGPETAEFVKKNLLPSFNIGEMKQADF